MAVAQLYRQKYSDTHSYTRCTRNEISSVQHCIYFGYADQQKQANDCLKCANEVKLTANGREFQILIVRFVKKHALML